VRILLGMALTLLVSAGTVGGIHARNDRAGGADSQASSPTTPTCDIQNATDCPVSKQKKEFIRWEAPSGEARHVCFPTTAPFGTDHFDVRPGHHKDSGPIKGSPATGTEYPYTMSKDPCNQSHSVPKNSAKVIVED
jgi:hypothetical protein